MNKSDILNMNAGKEMDALVAIRVMHFKQLPVNFSPSTDFNDAWEALETIREKQIPVQIRGDEWYDGGGWIVEIMDVLGTKVEHSCYIESRYNEVLKGWERPDIRLAICKATLLTTI